MLSPEDTTSALAGLLAPPRIAQPGAEWRVSAGPIAASLLWQPFFVGARHDAWVTDDGLLRQATGLTPQRTQLASATPSAAQTAELADVWQLAPDFGGDVALRVEAELGGVDLALGWVFQDEHLPAWRVDDGAIKRRDARRRHVVALEIGGLLGPLAISLDFAALPSHTVVDRALTPHRRPEIRWAVNLAATLAPWLQLTVEGAHNVVVDPPTDLLLQRVSEQFVVRTGLNLMLAFDGAVSFEGVGLWDLTADAGAVTAELVARLTRGVSLAVGGRLWIGDRLTSLPGLYADNDVVYLRTDFSY